MQRDSQRSRLYKAEDKALTPVETSYPEIADVTAYVEKVLHRAPIQRRYGKLLDRPVQIGDGRARSRFAAGSSSGIHVSRSARVDRIILHEVAHVLTQRLYGYSVAHHGPEFAAIFMDLVRFGMGSEAYEKLKAIFKADRVRFTPKRGESFKSATLAAGVKKPVRVIRNRAQASPPPEPKDPADIKAKAALQVLKRHYCFTARVTSDGYFETSPFRPFSKGFSTTHYGWTETLDRLRLCLGNPDLMDEDGYYSEG